MNKEKQIKSWIQPGRQPNKGNVQLRVSKVNESGAISKSLPYNALDMWHTCGTSSSSKVSKTSFS